MIFTCKLSSKHSSVIQVNIQNSGHQNQRFDVRIQWILQKIKKTITNQQNNTDGTTGCFPNILCTQIICFSKIKLYPFLILGIHERYNNTVEKKNFERINRNNPFHINCACVTLVNMCDIEIVHEHIWSSKNNFIVYS